MPVSPTLASKFMHTLWVHSAFRQWVKDIDIPSIGARGRKKNPSTLHVFYVLASLKFAFDYCSFTLYSLVLLPCAVCVVFFRRVVLLSKPQLIFFVPSIANHWFSLGFQNNCDFIQFSSIRSLFETHLHIYTKQQKLHVHTHIHNVEHKANCSKYTNENIQNRQRHQNRTKQRKICYEKKSAWARIDTTFYA